jgi:hypothetical protein
MEQGQSVLSPSGRYRAIARGNTIEIYEQEKEQTWIYFGHLEGIHRLPGEIISLSWESEQIICSSSTTGATHRWLTQQAIHLATPVVAYCLRPHRKEVPHG